MIFIKLLFSLSILSATTNNSTTRILGIGDVQKIQSPIQQTIRVEKKGIIQIKDRGSSLVIIGKKRGQTKIHIGSQIYPIHVLSKKSAKTYRNLKKWIQDKRGPQIDIIDDSVQLKGSILALWDYQELLHDLSEDSQFLIRSTIRPSLQEKIKNWIHTLLKKQNLPMGRLEFKPYMTFFIHSSLKPQISQYKKILGPLGLKILMDQQAYQQKPLIQIQLHIAHVKKSFLRHWGLSWPTQFQSQIIQGSASRLNEFTLSLNALESQGWGKVLSSPLLVAESGETAQFHSGGEFPIRTTTQFSNNVKWKPYGLFLKTKSSASSRQQMRIYIKTEFSSIDKSISSDGVPGLMKNTLETTVNLNKPRPLLLSGFIKKDQSQNREGLAWLSQIPLLKPLFSSGEIYNNEYELVFILNPSVL